LIRFYFSFNIKFVLDDHSCLSTVKDVQCKEPKLIYPINLLELVKNWKQLWWICSLRIYNICFSKQSSGHWSSAVFFYLNDIMRNQFCNRR